MHDDLVTQIEASSLCQLRGAPHDLDRLGAVLTGARPCPGRVIRVQRGWWQRATAHRALLLVDGVGTDDHLDRGPDIAVEDLSLSFVSLLLAGPHAARLATSGVAGVARPVMTVCDGSDRWRLVVPVADAAAARVALLSAA